MARCEDFPCCGHESGCCPDYDSGGRQLNMVCTCGAKLPINNRYSICDTCLNRIDPEDGPSDYYDDDRNFDSDDDRESMNDPYDSHYDREDYGDFGYDGCHEE